MSKIKLSYKTAANPNFLEAFDKLSEEPLSVKDRYALARTRNNIESALVTYEKLRQDLVKKLGVSETDIRSRQLAALPEGPSPMREVLEQRLEQAKLSKNIMIDTDDGEKSAKFKEEFEQLLDIEFEVFLDHQIKLTDDCKLSGKYMSSVIDLVTLSE